MYNIFCLCPKRGATKSACSTRFNSASWRSSFTVTDGRSGRLAVAFHLSNRGRLQIAAGRSCGAAEGPVVEGQRTKFHPVASADHLPHSPCRPSRCSAPSPPSPSRGTTSKLCAPFWARTDSSSSCRSMYYVIFAEVCSNVSLLSPPCSCLIPLLISILISRFNGTDLYVNGCVATDILCGAYHVHGEEGRPG